MSWFSELLAEARDDYAIAIACGVAAALVLLRAAAPAETRRLRHIVGAFALFVVVGGVAAVLRAGRSPAYADVRLAALLFAAISVVATASAVLFDLLLPLVRVRAPHILRDVIGAAAAVVAGLTVASRLGFNLSGIITTSAVLTAVIGFSLQDTLGNIMGGLALQLDNSIQVGDWVKVGDVRGRVSEIRWRYTAVETRNWETVVIPNGMLMKGQVIVLGRRLAKPVQWRRWVWFNVDFRYAPTDVIHAVNEAVQAAPIERVAAEPAPHAILMDLHESYGRYAVRYWLTDLAVDDPTDSAIRTRIYFALRRAGIPLSIPAQAVFLTEDTSERKAEKSRADRERRLRAVASVELFRRLEEDERAHLADGLRYAPFARGETLTRQGAEAHWLYMVIEGEVAVRVAVEDGLVREVARLGGGSFFGEMSLMTGEPRSATVVALTDVECFRLDRATFQDVIRRRPEVAADIAEVLARRRVELEAAKENLGEEAKRRRLAAAKDHLLDKIRGFFGLAEKAASAARPDQPSRIFSSPA